MKMEKKLAHEVFRQAVVGDIPAMHRVRLAVRENRLTSRRIGEADYVPEITATGRGWVALRDGAVAGFAIGNLETGNIWALFVDPDAEGCGYGGKLHDMMVSHMFGAGLERLRLGTAQGTRAERFYLARGWRMTGTDGGDVLMELRKGG
jgi:GNAT superfamily N-acetyltransferase